MRSSNEHWVYGHWSRVGLPALSGSKSLVGCAVVRILTIHKACKGPAGNQHVTERPAVFSTQPMGRTAEKRRSDRAGNRRVLCRAAAFDSFSGGRAVSRVAAATPKKNDALCGL